MGDFKREYRRAVDSIEPDSRLIECLKADMKAAEEVPPKPNFFVKYGWVFGSAAACTAVVLAVSMFFVLGRSGLNDSSSIMMEGASGNAWPTEKINDAAAQEPSYGANDEADAADIEYTDGAMLEAEKGTYVITTTTVSQPSAAENNADGFFTDNDSLSSDEEPPFSISDMPFTDGELSDFEPITDRRLREWTEIAEQGRLTYGDLEKCAHRTKLYKGLYTMGCMYLDEKTGQSYVLISCYFVQSADSAPAYVVLRKTDSGDTLDLLHEYDMLDRFLAQ